MEVNSKAWSDVLPIELVIIIFEVGARSCSRFAGTLAQVSRFAHAIAMRHLHATLIVLPWGADGLVRCPLYDLLPWQQSAVFPQSVTGDDRVYHRPLPRSPVPSENLYWVWDAVWPAGVETTLLQIFPIVRRLAVAQSVLLYIIRSQGSPTTSSPVLQELYLMGDKCGPRNGRNFKLRLRDYRTLFFPTPEALSALTHLRIGLKIVPEVIFFFTFRLIPTITHLALEFDEHPSECDSPVGPGIVRLFETTPRLRVVLLLVRRNEYYAENTIVCSRLASEISREDRTVVVLDICAHPADDWEEWEVRARNGQNIWDVALEAHDRRSSAVGSELASTEK